MKFTVGTVTDRGLNPKRAANEDRLLALPEGGVFLVADGVGGRRAGQVASQTVVDVFTEIFARRAGDDVLIALRRAIERSNRRIYDSSVATSELEGMATTIAVIAFSGNGAVIGHVGDSRVYRFDGQTLIRETEDHSELNEAMRSGAISAAQAAHHPHRGVLTRALGVEPEVEAEFKAVAVDDKTRFLLCSDGVTHHLSDHELNEMMRRPLHPRIICQQLKDVCFARGAEDNLSAVIVDVGEPHYLEAKLSGSSARPRAEERVLPASRIEVDLGAGNGAGEKTTAKPAPAAAPRREEATEAARSPRRWPWLLLLLAVAFGIGRYSDEVRQWVGAQGWFDSAPEPTGETDPAADPELAAARSLYEERRYDLARERFAELTRLKPERAEYLYWLGRSSYELKRYPDAIRELSEAARLDPRLPNIYIHLALAYRSVGDRRNAEASLRRALQQ
jgi:protein phosphatase